jgi:ribosomal-protein-alanine acetyltransferase
VSARLRRARLADLPDLLELDAACFARPWTEAGWRAELDDRPGQLVLFAAAGFACAPLLLDTCELRRIAVIPSARGSGLARDLLAGVIAHARDHGATAVELEVAADNLVALALYRRAGFVEVGRRPRYYSNPPTDAVLMTLDLRSGVDPTSRNPP